MNTYKKRNLNHFVANAIADVSRVRKHNNANQLFLNNLDFNAITRRSVCEYLSEKLLDYKTYTAYLKHIQHLKFLICAIIF